MMVLFIDFIGMITYTYVIIPIKSIKSDILENTR